MSYAHTGSTTSARAGQKATAGRAGDIALIAVFAALLAAFAIMPPIPVGPAGVPITLQTFAIALCGLVLGPWRGERRSCSTSCSASWACRSSPA